MGWFDEQIKQRKLSDQEVFEDSFIQLANSLSSGMLDSGLNSDRYIGKQAIDEILKYYRHKPVELPDNIKEFDELLEFALRPHGIMHRNIKLEKGWQKDSFGAILAFRKEDSSAVAMIPKPFFGYYFIDKNGAKVNVTDKVMEDFEDEGICFYRPLPLKTLGIPDLLLYLKDCFTPSDILLIEGITLFVVLLGFVSPRVYKLLTGPVLKSRNIGVLLSMAVFMISLNMSTMLINTIKSMLMERISIKASLSVQAAVMIRLLNLPANFFRRYSSGELSSRASSVSSLCNMILNGVFSTGLTSLMSLLYITQIFNYAPALVIPSIITILVTVIMGVVSTLMQISISRKQMELAAKESGMTYALLSGIQKIKLSGAEKRAFARWANLYAKESQYEYNPPMFLKVNSVISTAISLFSTIILYYLAVQSGVDQSNYFAFNSSYGMVMGAFQSLAGIVLNVAQIQPIMEMAEPILKEVPENSEGKQILTSISGGIEMNNVFFRYEENTPYIVNDLSLKIRPGEYVAIVGKTGCGKSTLIRLLLGFEKPEKGAIYYDGKDMNKIDLRSLRRKIGTVTQNGSLFTGDIFSNITISAPELTLDAAWEAAEIAGIADDIREMPMGMNTLITEGAGGISGGQKQRLMIARAIAFKPKILIFDEATSALDNKTQKKVSDALDKLKCTRIVIAHRLSTIKHCDRILVLDSGKIIESGTYDELIKQKGFFADLVERQRLGNEEDEEPKKKKTVRKKKGK